MVSARRRPQPTTPCMPAHQGGACTLPASLQNRDTHPPRSPPSRALAPARAGAWSCTAKEGESGALLKLRATSRDSVASSSGDSVFSLLSDSDYPSGITYGQRRMVSYAYDPPVDDKEPPDEEDLLHDPERNGGSVVLLRGGGFLNVGVLMLLLFGLLCLFLS